MNSRNYEFHESSIFSMCLAFAIDNLNVNWIAVKFSNLVGFFITHCSYHTFCVS